MYCDERELDSCQVRARIARWFAVTTKGGPRASRASLLAEQLSSSECVPGAKIHAFDALPSTAPRRGASSTQMQEIAQATNNFADFNEIMPAIYRNFMEKEVREWRMIYKALVLLEYIVKHGSERVVDDARSHLGTIKILRNFHYIDEQGKDQGINGESDRLKLLCALC